MQVRKMESENKSLRVGRQATLEEFKTWIRNQSNVSYRQFGFTIVVLQGRENDVSCTVGKVLAVLTVLEKKRRLQEVVCYGEGLAYALRYGKTPQEMAVDTYLRKVWK